MNTSALFLHSLPGFINGLLGTGGGIIAVSLLRKEGCSANAAHATSVALMLPISAVSLGVYFCNNGVSLFEYLPLCIPAAAGALFGAKLLKKISSRLLRFLFALLLLYSGIRLLLP